MKVLRHEEFEEGCRAACNGPYDLNWSKTMVGYGQEDNHFVVELTYNYGVGSYERGNDFLGIVIRSDDIVERARRHSWLVQEKGDVVAECPCDVVVAPGGYPFLVCPKENHERPLRQDPVERIILSSSDLARTTAYWKDILAMTLVHSSEKSAVLAYANDQCHLEFRYTAEPIQQRHGVRKDRLQVIENRIKLRGHRILTPLTRLDTPGKATVTVVILADPDGHEICFVDAESFMFLSAVDPNANQLLSRAIEEDKSDEWFRDMAGGKKPSA
ncbi:hypothetical protein HPB47_025409 [Ixodes persulcatus]|uniref:Uncharacterized protein n=1 Tax=Ixodes persulcatus TaxID=34615 RepID=A0AC60Q1H9_IXOPE|nr:hypothetical protein HPB47_025409 [Ixodes persulcatus]